MSYPVNRTCNGNPMTNDQIKAHLSEIHTSQREHAAIIADLISSWHGQGAAPQITCPFTHKVYTVVAPSRWDEGLYVSDGSRAFMHRSKYSRI